MMQVEVAMRGLAWGNVKKAKRIGAPISCCLPYSQIYISLLFCETKCTPDPLAILFLHMIRVDTYDVVSLTMCFQDLQLDGV